MPTSNSGWYTWLRFAKENFIWLQEIDVFLDSNGPPHHTNPSFVGGPFFVISYKKKWYWRSSLSSLIFYSTNLVVGEGKPGVGFHRQVLQAQCNKNVLRRSRRMAGGQHWIQAELLNLQPCGSRSMNAFVRKIQSMNTYLLIYGT